MMKSYSRRGAALARLAALALTLALLTACGGATSKVASPTPTPTSAATATPVDPTVRQVFEQGVAFPRWGTGVYGATDGTWSSAVQSMRARTNARWVGMIVSLDQNGDSSTTVYAGPDTTSPDALYVGILNARQAGLKVFIEPLLNVRNARSNWSGEVSFATEAEATQWFHSYWSAYKPYVEAAKAAGASQIAIAAEYEALEPQYPDLWLWLTHQVKATFGGTVTYDMNHSSMDKAVPAWMKDPALSYIGVSLYVSLQQSPQPATVAQIEDLWRSNNVLPLLDALSAQLGKPVFLSEIGYRDRSDCLYLPWIWETGAPADPALQGAAYQVAMTMTASDPHIAGIFFWGWQTGQFSPGADAIQAMHAAWAHPLAP